MKKWHVRIPMYADAFYEIEAENEEAAIEKAYERHSPSICHQCSQHIELGEFDVSADPSAEDAEA
jgi:hypothetical protein